MTNLQNRIEELTRTKLYVRNIKTGSLKGCVQFESRRGKFTRQAMENVAAEYSSSIVTPQTILI